MANPDQKSPSSPATPARWILLVDDEPAMRSLIETVLETQNWAVRAVPGAAAALAMISSAATPPTLMICDVMMPGVDGLELTRRMLAKLPTLKVILISGHLVEASWWPTDLREVRFLTKPFSNDQLIQAVKEATDPESA